MQEYSKNKQNLITLGLLLINGGTFWVAIITDFFVYKRIALNEAIFFVAVFQLLVLVFEFPTGIIGDKFGHKISILLGAISTICGLFLLAFNPSIKWLYYIAMLITALGNSLVSGSDMALLSTTSADFKKANAKYGIYSLVLQIIVISSGSIFYKFFPEAPFLLNILFMIVGSLIIFSEAKNVQNRNDGNVFNFGLDAIKYFINNKSLLLLTAAFSLLVASFAPIKWIISTLFTSANISPIYWGSLFCLLFVGRIIGNKISLKVNPQHVKHFVLAFVVFLFLSTIVQSPILSYLSLFLMSINYGVLETEFTLYISQVTEISYKASVFSLRAFVSRLASSLILYLISLFSISGTYINSLTVLLISSLVMYTLYLSYVVVSKKINKF
jgi:MFS family permease